LTNAPEALTVTTQPFYIQRYFFLFGLFLGLLTSTLQAQEKETKPRHHEHWAKEIAKFEESDKQKMPPKNGILFAGSSTMVFWNTQKAFPDLPTINRGFGGSYLSDSVYFATRIITKYEPRMVLVYAGDNDLAGGVTPAQLTKDFQDFVKIIHDKLPKTRILFISVKPSTKRWELFDKQKEANRMIEDFCKKDDRLQYVDIVKPLLDASGKPRKELLREDGLHLNEKGYEVLNGIVRPLIEKS
jgi:lysophospholipase L1-like esterase